MMKILSSAAAAAAAVAGAALIFLVVAHNLLLEARADSSAVSRKGRLTLNSFEEGGDGGAPSECDESYHSDSFLVVALSTRWYEEDNRRRCNHSIIVDGNGNSAVAKVVDECDTSRDCLGDDIVDGSMALWLALGVEEDSDLWGEMPVTWSDP